MNELGRLPGTVSRANTLNVYPSYLLSPWEVENHMKPCESRVIWLTWLSLMPSVIVMCLNMMFSSAYPDNAARIRSIEM